MNIYAVIHGVNAITALVAASIIFFSKSRKPIHLGHGWFSLLLFLYTFPYFLWGIQTHKENSLFLLSLVIYSVCIIHSAYLHYALILSNTLKKHRYFLISGYTSSLFLLCMQHRAFFYDSNNLRIKGPFSFWPRGTGYLFVLIGIQIFYVLAAFFILWRASRKNSDPASINLKAYLIISIIGWLGGLSNWICFWDFIFVLPIGNLGVTLLIIGTYYLIFKRDFLELSEMVKKTFVCALLTLFITLVFAVFVLVGEKISRAYFGYSSFFSTLLAGLVVALMFNPVRSLFNRLINKAIYGKDIVELSVENLKMQIELEKQDRMKLVATLAAGMAHEIKNPITAIRTFAEFLPKKYEDPEFREKFSKLLVEETGRVSGIIRDLLLFARPSEPVIGSCDIGAILKSLADLLRGDLIKHSIRIDFCINSESFICRADSSQIKQALLNIMMNAIDAMKTNLEAKRLILNLRREGDKLKVLIEDTGKGIAPEKIQYLFDPFYTDKADGTGLGLAITRSIIEKNHGKIRVVGEAGKGAKFLISLPIRDA